MRQATFHKEDADICKGVLTLKARKISAALTTIGAPQDLNAPETVNPYTQTCGKTKKSPQPYLHLAPQPQAQIHKIPSLPKALATNT